MVSMDTMVGASLLPCGDESPILLLSFSDTTQVGLLQYLKGESLGYHLYLLVGMEMEPHFALCCMAGVKPLLSKDFLSG